MVDEHSFLGFNAFMFIAITVFCLLVGYVIKKKRLMYLPDSVSTLAIGFMIGGILSLLSEDESSTLQFSPNLFFFVLIPPIIFEAGYTLKRKDFFRNIGAIVMYAVIGTIISALSCGYILFAFAKAGIVPLDRESALESLLFGTAISATDSVAILALLGSPELNADPMLYSLVFGESVLNDAVVIVLYNTFETFLGQSISAGVIFGGVGSFFVTAIGSTVIGGLVGLVCCLLFKYVVFTDYPVYELTLTLSFAYISYFVAEFMHLSGIMSLFFCAIVLAHYNHYNISEESQISTHESFKSFAQISETFVFAYMGIQLGVALSPHAPPELSWDIPLVAVLLFGAAVSRFLNIFPLSIIVNHFRELKIPIRMQIPMWFSGLRGAVAFALAMKVPTDAGPYIITATLATVIATLSAGGLAMPILKYTRMTDSNIQQEFDDKKTFYYYQQQRGFMARMTAAWLRFDNSYMKRFFGRHHDPTKVQVTGMGYSPESMNVSSSNAPSNTSYAAYVKTDDSLVSSISSVKNTLTSKEKTEEKMEEKEQPTSSSAPTSSPSVEGNGGQWAPLEVSSNVRRSSGTGREATHGGDTGNGQWSSVDSGDGGGGNGWGGN